MDWFLYNSDLHHERVNSNKYGTLLILPVPIPDKEKKLNQMFISTLLCGASKGFMKTFKAFIKPFEASQRRLKKINLIFISTQVSEMHGTLKVNFSKKACHEKF